MYKVVELENSSVVMVRTLFKSENLNSCWNFVKNRPLKDLYVMDRLDQYIDPPADVIALKRWAKERG